MKQIINLIEEVIEKANSNECCSYWDLINVPEELHDKDKNLVIILKDVLSYHMNLDNPKRPFQPFAILKDKRTAALEDLKPNDLDILLELYKNINDCEIQARIADVIWTKYKQYKYGEESIGYYILSANRLLDWTHWTQYHARIKRALQIALLLNKNIDEVNEVIKNTILDINGKDPSFLTGKLIELLLEQKNITLDPFIEILNKNIQNNLEHKEYRIARYYMDLKIKCYKKQGLKCKVEDITKRKAFSYEEEVNYLLEKDEDKNKNILIVHLLEKAVTTYRTISGTKKQIDDILLKIDKYKKGISKNLKEISHEIDITNIIEEIKKHFSDSNKFGCIFKIAFIYNITSKDNLKDNVIKIYKNSPLSFLASNDIIDQNGRRIVRMPDLNASTVEAEEYALEAYMLKEAARNHAFIGNIVINNALKYINEKHEIYIEDLKFIVENNLFIPTGREDLFLEGLYEGFKGNFMKAIHILIPQLENSFREFAKMCGDNVVTFEDDGKEQAKPLNSIFELTNFVNCYDEDLLFNLRSLLTEKYGSNMRNRFAHGLLTSEESTSSISIYVWWISLRLCCMYYFEKSNQ